MLDNFQDKNRKLDAQMDSELTVSSILGGAAILIAAALLSVVLIVLLRPLLARYAIVRPNARSSHTIPTPQGGGIAVIAAALGVSGATLYFFPVGATAATQLSLVFVAVVFIAGVGVLADIHPENVALRLLLQTLAVTAVIFVLPPGLRILPILPLAAERVALVIGGLWFVNLVNFMDGLDWMTAAEVVPITAALAVIGLLGLLPPVAIIVSLASVRRHDRLCLFQSAGCKALSWRRWQPSGRAFARLVASFASRQWRTHRGNPAAVILCRRLRPSRLCAACETARRSGGRIARISISAPRTAALRSSTW